MATTAVAPERCLSDLPDEILQHILGFAPPREAASTAVLSRRWRGLWPPTRAGAVNLDTCSYGSDRQAFFRGAEAAVAAHGGSSMTRLTVHIEGPYTYIIQGFMSQSCWIEGRHCPCVYDLLGLPAIRAVEELSIGASLSYSSKLSFAAADDESAMPDVDEGLYSFSTSTLPSEALRVLRITNCRDLERPLPATGFQRLEVLLLRKCTVSLDTLQDIVVASPELTTLQLERVYLTTTFRRPVPNYYNDKEDDFDDDRVESFCCPAVITLSLLNCRCREGVAIELDAPRMRQFRYRGCTHQFTLKSPPPDLRRADLHVLDNDDDDDCPASEFFWRFVKNLRDTKVLKLKFNFPISEIAVADKKIFEEIIGENRFCNLDLLEIDVQQHKRSSSKDNNAAGVAIGNLLQCCPAVPELRLKLGTVEETPNRRREDCSERNRKAQLDFRKSVRHFTRRREPAVSSFGEDDAHKFEVSDIPGLSDKWFDLNCLRFYLKRVSLQFQMDKYSNCFGVQLLKFFMERAMVLEEIYIDDGNKKLWDHMNRNIGEACSGFSLAGASLKVPGANRLDYSSKICGRFSYPKIEVRRKNPWSNKGIFTILPLDR